jgi:hypothetical protein
LDLDLLSDLVACEDAHAQVSQDVECKGPAASAFVCVAA